MTLDGTSGTAGVQGAVEVVKQTGPGRFILGGDFRSISQNSQPTESQFMAEFDLNAMVLKPTSISPLPGPVKDVAVLDGKMVALTGRYYL